MSTTDPTKLEIEQVLDLVLMLAGKAMQDTIITDREKALAQSVVTLDRYMRHGGSLPRRWIERRTKCRAAIAEKLTALSKSPTPNAMSARCALEKGHGGKCEP